MYNYSLLFASVKLGELSKFFALFLLTGRNDINKYLAVILRQSAISDIASCQELRIEQS